MRRLCSFIPFLNPNRDDTLVWFQLEALISTEVPGPFGFNPPRDSRGRRRRCNPSAGPLESRRRRPRDSIMAMARFSICYALQSQRAGATPAPGRRRRRLERTPAPADYIMTMARFSFCVMLLGVKAVSSSRQSCAMRCNPSAMYMSRFTIYVMLLGVTVVNSCRQGCAMRCNPSAGTGTGITS